MLKFILISLCLTSSVFAADVEILSWYRLNAAAGANDLAAEVCFKVNPAPTGLSYARIIVDRNTRSQAHYNTLIDQTGVACHVVATVRGTIFVGVPGAANGEELLSFRSTDRE